jgi:hypothetical protein
MQDTQARHHSVAVIKGGRSAEVTHDGTEAGYRQAAISAATAIMDDDAPLISEGSAVAPARTHNLCQGCGTLVPLPLAFCGTCRYA